MKKKYRYDTSIRRKSHPTVQKFPNFGSEATRSPFSNVVTLVSFGKSDDVAYTGWPSHATGLLKGILVIPCSAPEPTSPENNRITADPHLLKCNKIR